MDLRKKYVIHGQVLIKGALTLNLSAQRENEGVNTRNSTDAKRPSVPKNIPASIHTPARATAILIEASR
jgi:hypothetical protein